MSNAAEGRVPVPKTAHIVSHTHWDREWYLPFHTYRVWLTKNARGVFDALEHEASYEHFCLDGQSVILEDLLEVCPEEEERIRRLAASGALALGPWYVLPDEFLIPPEATVRNLVLGHKVAARVGEAQKVGYAPDAFGHIGQMPQILRKAGIDSFLYTRGNGDEVDDLGLEWTWRAPDGSEVLAILQGNGYCNASGLGYQEMWHAHTQRDVDPERAVEQIRALFEKLAQSSHGDVWLLMNGCDHFPVQKDFGIVLERLREAFPDTAFLHTSLADYVKAVREARVPAPAWQGELRGGKLHHVLSGVWSARMPLKQQNDLAHTMLADVWEPLAASTHFLSGFEYPQGLLEYAWMLLLKNQPHDSICGCSIDEVHREMGPRFEGVQQTAARAVEDALVALVPSFGRQPQGDRDTVLGVFHALPESRRALLDRLVVLEPLGYRVEDLRVVDEDGVSLPFEILATPRVQRFWGIDWRRQLDVEGQQARFDTYAETMGRRFLEPEEDDGLVDTFLHLRVLADLPPVGYARLRLVEESALDAPRLAKEERVHVGEQTLENALVRVRLHEDGTFDLADRRTGRRFEGLHVLEDVGDVGDEYDFSPAQEGRPLTSAGLSGSVHVVDTGDLAGALEARFVLQIPRRIESNRRLRSEDSVACPVRVRIGLQTGSPVVDVDVAFENGAEDHRLTAVFSAGVRTDTIVSDAHFMLAERPVDPPDGDDWVQPPPDTVPQQEFSLLQDEAGGLAVLARGLPEVATVRDEGSERDEAGRTPVGLRLTLLRSVGWLSRDDFATRRCQNAGPTIATPEAQCLGPQRFRYAVLPLSPDESGVDVKRWSRRWRTPIPCVQGVLDGSTPGGRGLVELASGRTFLTAIKRHEARDTLVLRLYNPSGEPVVEDVRLGLPVTEAWRTDLLEEREEALPLAGASRLALSMGPYEILTVEIACGEGLEDG